MQSYDIFAPAGVEHGPSIADHSRAYRTAQRLNGSIAENLAEVVVGNIGSERRGK